MKRTVLAAATVILFAACGGTGATQAPSQAAQPSHASSSQGGQAGQPIDVAGIQAAVTALKTQHDAWQFSATTYQSGTPNYSQTIAGTQRTKPQPAISATLTRSGVPDKLYVRIGDDIWYDTGTGSYTQTTASDTAVVSQFEPFSIDGLVQAATAGNYQYEPVGTETVGGVTTTHYRLQEATIQSIVQNMTGMTTADWAADVYIANADGSMLRIAWGPRSADKAGLTTGVDYTVTAIDCLCPVDPPTAVPSGS